MDLLEKQALVKLHYPKNNLIAQWDQLYSPFSPSYTHHMPLQKLDTQILYINIIARTLCSIIIKVHFHHVHYIHLQVKHAMKKVQ